MDPGFPSAFNTAAWMRHYAKLRARYTGQVLAVLHTVLADNDVPWILTGPTLISLVRYGEWDYIDEDFVEVTDNDVEVAMLFSSRAGIHLKCM